MRQIPLNIGLGKSLASVKADRVIDNWVTLIEDAAGRAEDLQKAIDETLKENKLPNVTWSTGQVGTGFMSASREFMIIKHSRLREYTIYLFARDIGKHLSCGWFMAVEPGMFKKTFSKHISGNPIALSQNLDIFAQEDLQAWKQVVHRTFVKHAREIMGQLKQDAASMNTQSKGFLSVW